MIKKDLTPYEVACLLQVHPSYVRYLCRTGRILAHRKGILGGGFCYQIPSSEVQRYLDNQPKLGRPRKPSRSEDQPNSKGA